MILVQLGWLIEFECWTLFGCYLKSQLKSFKWLVLSPEHSPCTQQFHLFRRCLFVHVPIREAAGDRAASIFYQPKHLQLWMWRSRPDLNILNVWKWNSGNLSFDPQLLLVFLFFLHVFFKFPLSGHPTFEIHFAPSGPFAAAEFKGGRCEEQTLMAYLRCPNR